MCGRMYIQVFYLMVALYLSITSGQRVVDTDTGKIQGTAESAAGSTVYTFYGIPYAKPPINEMRFRKPVKMDPFQFQFNASLFGAMCTQYTPGSSVWHSIAELRSTVDEDCLYLNIYVPDGAGPFPVMVFLEGEGFITGRSDIYKSQELAVKGGIVVVTLNYRLGVFGFMWTGSNDAPGNMGLWDQRMALQWVQDHIVAFRGDKQQVTLVGHSAGAASAALHSLSEQSNGLFHRVICQSGSATAPWAVNTATDALKYAVALGQNKNCFPADDKENLDKMVACLKNDIQFPLPLYAQALSQGRIDPHNGIISSVWVPVIDGEFIKDDPAKLLQDAAHLASVRFFERDFMIGVTSNEGEALPDIVRLNFGRSQGSLTIDNLLTETGMNTRYYMENVVPSIVREVFRDDSDLAATGFTREYTAGLAGGEVISYATIFPPFGDALFVSPAVQLARAHSASQSNSGNTYLYLFDHSAVAGLLENPHGSDLPYVFGLNNLVSRAHLMPPDFSTDDQTFSDQVVAYWSNFIKSGNPNKPDNNVPANWPVFDPTTESYLTLALDMSNDKSVRQRLYDARVSFWLDYMPRLFAASKQATITCPAVPTTTPTTPTPTSKTTTTTPMPTSKTTTETSTVSKEPTAAPQTKNTDQVTATPCRNTTTASLERFLERLGMDADTAETTIIALAAATGAFGLIALIVSCMLCAKRRKRPEYY